MIYIGGSTQTFEFDFSTKIANSTKDCPLNIYYSLAKNIKTPNDSLNSSWKDGWDNWANKSQDILDKLKVRDNLSFELSSTSAKEDKAGRTAQILMELDLNPIANDLFGGSNDAFKNAIKALEVDVYASGSGAKDGQKAYGVNIAWYNQGSTSAWEWTRQDYSSDISRINKKVGTEYNIQKTLSKDNKVYFLINALYPSSESTPSVINLDYFNIKVILKNRADDIETMPINMLDKGSILMRICPDFSCEQEYHALFDINDGTWDNRLACHFGKNEKGGIALFSVKDKKDIWNLNCSSSNLFDDKEMLYKPYKIFSLLLNWDNTIKKAWRSILYDKNVIYLETNITDVITGNLNLNLCRLLSNNNELNGFLEDFQYMPDKTWTKEEAEKLLKGEHKYLQMSNMLPDFTNKNWRINSAAVVAKKNLLKLKSDEAYNGSIYTMPVLPNNKYKFTGKLSSEKIHVAIGELSSTKTASITDFRRVYDTRQCSNGEFTVSNNTVAIQIVLTNDQKCDDTFEDIQLKLIP